jgi:starvation-inducible DNA-binding protein
MSRSSIGGEIASPATSSHLPALGGPHERDGLGHELQATLHELVALALIGKQLHWAVVGPFFQPLHTLIDQFVDSWRELADTVAERAVALGYVPDGQAHAVASGSQLVPVAQAPLEGHLVVWEVTHRIAIASERARTRMDRLGEIDLASQDILIEVVRTLEGHQWMLRAQLGSRPVDG